MASPNGSPNDGLTWRNTPRVRVAKACDICRRRKEKCNGSRPICSTCRQAERPCQYSGQPKRRGLPEGWVKALEKLWSLSMLAIPQLESVVLATLRETLSGVRPQLASIWSGRGSDMLLNHWKSSNLSHELQRLLHELDHTTTELRDDDLTNVMGQLFPSHSLVPLRIEQHEVDADHFTDNDSPLGSCSIPHPLPESSSPVPEDATNLIETYLSCVQSWLPALDGQHLHRTSYRWGRGEQAPSSGDEASLYAVFALARLVSGAQLQPGPSTLEAIPLPSVAQSALFDTANIVEIGHVHALLIRSLHHIYRGENDNAWFDVGQASRLALLLQCKTTQGQSDGLEINASQSTHSRNALLACFVLETTLGAALEMPAVLRSNDLARILPLDEDVPEEWEPGKTIASHEATIGTRLATPGSGISTFNHLVKIFKIQNEILEQDRAPHPNADVLAALNRRIRAMNADQPQHLHLDLLRPPESYTNFHPQQYTLRLAQLVTFLMSCKYPDQPDNDASCIITQIGELVTAYAARFHMRSVPIIWQPLFEVTARHLEEMAYSTAVQNAADELSKFVSVVSDFYPAFASLEPRLTALRTATPSMAHTLSVTSPTASVAPPSYQYQPLPTNSGFAQQTDESLPNTLLSSDVDTGNLEMSVETGVSLERHFSNTYNPSLVGSGSERELDVQDFLTTDALTW